MIERRKDVLFFENEYCCFKPYDWTTIEGVRRPVTLKVVTDNYQSLGLRRNPNILTFSLGQWVQLDEKSIKTGKGDWGGIWSTLTISRARELGEYMNSNYNINTNIFLTALDKPLYANSYRVKSGGVMLLEEIKKLERLQKTRGNW